MFDIGFTELLIVAVVALVVLGPEKLPTAIRTVGLWVGKIKRAVSSVQSEISEELRLDELKRTASIKKEELEKELNDMRQPFSAALDEASPLAKKVSSVDELQAAAELEPVPSVKKDEKAKDSDQ